MKKNMMSKGPIFIFSIIFILLALLMGLIYTTGLNRPAVVYAIIPQLTKSYLSEVTEKIPDQGLYTVERGPFDWANDKDQGNDQSWSKEESSNIIVYYHKDKEAVWQKYAQNTLKEAESIIPELESLMGKYYYPSDVNKRKLPIYLTNTPADYTSTIQLLMQGHGNGSGSAGIFISEVGPAGCMAKGIVLHPSCFEDNSPNNYRKTLRHEMNHYVFYSALNYGKEIHHYLWVCEGLAEYFCNSSNGRPITGMDSLNLIAESCKLTAEFPQTMNSEYWAGESFFNFLEQAKGKEGVKKFIQNTYNYSTDSTFVMCKLNPNTTHEQWVTFLNNAAVPEAPLADAANRPQAGR